MTPKSHLRSKEAVSPSTSSRRAPSSASSPTTVDPAKARKVILCSGKVYWDLANARAARNVTDVAVVRLEQLYPLSRARARRRARPYRAGTPSPGCRKTRGTWAPGTSSPPACPSSSAGAIPLSCVARDERLARHGLGRATASSRPRLLDKAFA